MKRMMIGCVLALGLVTMPLAQAQDCCFEPQFNPCGSGFDFNGFYVGGNAGVFTHVAHLTDASNFVIGTPITAKNNETKAEAGVQVGYDWQCCAKLFGIVGDWSWTNAHKKTLIGTGGGEIRSRVHWFSTIRARAGLALSDALFYVTLGAAAARFRNRLFNNVATFTPFHERHTRWGWVGGAGAELMLFCNFSIAAEVLFLHFNQRQRTFINGPAPGTRFRFAHNHQGWVARVLVNYRFGDLFGCGF